jgi:hypothetical protein
MQYFPEGGAAIGPVAPAIVPGGTGYAPGGFQLPGGGVAEYIGAVEGAYPGPGVGGGTARGGGGGVGST